MGSDLVDIGILNLAYKAQGGAVRIVGPEIAYTADGWWIMGAHELHTWWKWGLYVTLNEGGLLCFQVLDALMFSLLVLTNS